MIQFVYENKRPPFCLHHFHPYTQLATNVRTHIILCQSSIEVSSIETFIALTVSVTADLTIDDSNVVIYLRHMVYCSPSNHKKLTAKIHNNFSTM